MNGSPPEKIERNAAVVARWRSSRLTQREVAAEFGITPARVQQILNAADKRGKLWPPTDERKRPCP